MRREIVKDGWLNQMLDFGPAVSCRIHPEGKTVVGTEVSPRSLRESGWFVYPGARDAGFREIYVVVDDPDDDFECMTALVLAYDETLLVEYVPPGGEPMHLWLRKFASPATCLGPGCVEETMCVQFGDEDSTWVPVMRRVKAGWTESDLS